MNTTLSNSTSIDLTYLDKHNEEDEMCYAYAYQLLNSCTLPMVLKVTAKIGVFQVIHDQASVNGLSPTEIATRIEATNPEAPTMLDRMLRLLATYSVVRCTVVPTAEGRIERRYSPSQVTRFFVPKDDNVSLVALLNLQNDQVLLESWSKVDDAIIKGGIPFDMVHGMSVYEYTSVDPRFNEVVNKAMYQTTSSHIKKILEKYKGFENIERVVDVGGGLGHTLGIITSVYTTIKGINFDLPHVIFNAPTYPGVEHVSGDMFESIPKGDAIFLKWILHNWSDENCTKLLKICYKALPNNGKVIVVEAIMEDDAVSTDSSRGISLMDVHMMAQTPRGKERSRHEFEALAKSTGFSTVNFDCCTLNFWVMEFYK